MKQLTLNNARNDYSPKVSIIVPVYNAADYLVECLDSIICQTLYEIEILLVDDGSTDKSGEICDEYLKKDNRIRVLHIKNSGVSVARNVGIDVAKGEFIGFVDSDDYISPEMYERMYDTAIMHGADIVMCDFERFNNLDVNRMTSPIREGKYFKEQIINEIYPNLISNKFDIGVINSQCFTISKKELWDLNSIRYEPKIRYCEDIVTSVDLMTHASCFYYLKDHVYYHYRYHKDSRSRYYNNEKIDYYYAVNKTIEAKVCSEKYNFLPQIEKQRIYFSLITIRELCNASLRFIDKYNTIKKILKNLALRKATRQICVDNFSNVHWKKVVILYFLKYRFALFLMIVYKCLT